MDTRDLTDMVSNFSCTDIFAFPPESISHSILELDPSRAIPDNKIPGALEEVSLFKYIPKQLFLRRILVMEILCEHFAILDSSNGLPFLAQAGLDAEPGLRISIRHLCVWIIFDNKDFVFEESFDRTRKSNLPDTPCTVAKIVKSGYSFRGPIELTDLRNPKALAERFPDVTTQSISTSHDARVIPVIGRCRGCQKVTTEFSNVQGSSGPRFMDIFPELRSRELAAQAQSRCISNRITQASEERGAVEEGERRVCTQWVVLGGIVDVDR